MKIFEKFFNGLEEKYPNEKKRCKIIITKCLYFSDITPMNVFITSEILKCEIQSRTGNIKELKYEFNSNVGNTLELDINKKWGLDKFDAVIGNPPYNSSGDTATGNTIWQDFTRKALNELLCDKGLLLFVHPPGWRKPNTEKGKFYGMFELMTQKNQMVYLEIHSIKDGQRVFKCGTRYDWYLIEHIKKYKNTIIVDENNKKTDINLDVFKWLPNSNILEIMKIIGKNDDEKNIMIYSPSAYEHRKKWMSHIKTEEYKFECIHSTPKTGIRYMYSNCNNKGHFGISKVIFGEAGINDVIVDINGIYGLTNGAIGIKIDDIETGNNIKKALKSNKFQSILNSCLFSSYRIDWNIFKEFKKDFWKEFVENNNNENNEEEQNKVIKRTKSSKTTKDDNKKIIKTTKIEKVDTSEEEKEQKPIKVKKNKSTMNKTK